MPSSMPSSNADRNEPLVVRSHGRVHFGLLEISESEPNCFGGIGLMIEHSNAIVHASVGKCTNVSIKILADSYWKPRIEAVAHQWQQTQEHLPVQSISVIDAPLPHQGLGSGTQMASTIASLLISGEDFITTRDWDSAKALSKLISIQTLSQLSQRGKRSNIGLRGFLEGGFILDHGILPPKSFNPASTSRTERFDFPNWPVLIIQDTTSTGDSGNNEAAMFERCRHQSNPNRESMIQLVRQEILPAIDARDWEQWNIAIRQYGRWSGKIFESVQGGIYRTSQIAKAIAVANELGLVGAVQSSWGPTVCAVAQDDGHASWCATRLRTELPQTTITVTKAANHPAQVSRS